MRQRSLVATQGPPALHCPEPARAGLRPSCPGPLPAPSSTGRWCVFILGHCVSWSGWMEEPARGAFSGACLAWLSPSVSPFQSLPRWVHRTPPSAYCSGEHGQRQLRISQCPSSAPFRSTADADSASFITDHSDGTFTFSF